VNDVAELKQYIRPHVRGQGISHPGRVLDAIHTDGDGPGSWTAEWCRVAESLERRGRHLEAARHYAMARFPYVDGSARQDAQDRCVAAFDQWLAGQPAIEAVPVDLPDGRMRCLASGLSATEPRPLLLLMGGIVSLKEQNAAALTNISRLGMAGVVAELPGVGENTAPYTADSASIISALLDALADLADVKNTYAIAMSFSGHLALRCALDDPRLRGVVTVGAPLREFFTDDAWRRTVPRLTVDTLAHLTGAPDGDVRGWAFTAQELAALDIPVHYASCRRDEIIPPGEQAALRDHVRQTHLIEYDDVHGAPNHVAETRLWGVAAVLRMRGALDAQGRLVDLLWRARRTGRRLLGR
jgi:pimeloyl-ACP methyl ester carboxylesterase